MREVICGILSALSFYLILADALKLPYMKTSRALGNLVKRGTKKTGSIDIWLGELSGFIASKLKLDRIKRENLESDLIRAGISDTPEKFTADGIVRSLPFFVLSLPIFFFFPLFGLILAAGGIIRFISFRGQIKKRLKIKREKIEYELPRLVCRIEKTLMHSRDVIFMLESYIPSAGDELKKELEITVADMKSGNHEGALLRLESRVPSPMMSDISRGLAGIIRGDDTQVYWSTLAIKFSDSERQRLRAKAGKIPRKVNRLSMCMLICFMLTYIVVILGSIMDSLGVLFG